MPEGKGFSLQRSPTAEAGEILARATAISRGGDYAQINLTASGLPGTVDTSSIAPNATAFENFVNQMAFQHVDEYFTLLNMQALLPILQAVRQAAGNRRDPSARLAAIRSRLEQRGRINALRQRP